MFKANAMRVEGEARHVDLVFFTTSLMMAAGNACPAFLFVNQAQNANRKAIDNDQVIAFAQTSRGRVLFSRQRAQHFAYPFRRTSVMPARQKGEGRQCPSPLFQNLLGRPNQAWPLLMVRL